MAVVDEFAPDETVNAGVIKNLTGGIDNLYARDIQQKGKDVIDIDPFFKLIFICNTIPNIEILTMQLGIELELFRSNQPLKIILMIYL